MTNYDGFSARIAFAPLNRHTDEHANEITLPGNSRTVPTRRASASAPEVNVADNHFAFDAFSIHFAEVGETFIGQGEEE